MKARRKKRLILAIFIVFGMTTAAALSLYALNQNIDLYFTPSQLRSHHVEPSQIIRLGGFVQKGSVHHAKHGLKMDFLMTDHKQKIQVDYTGVLPNLFHDGQGVVVQGRLNKEGVFIADQVLAKHDAKYLPPGITI